MIKTVKLTSKILKSKRILTIFTPDNIKGPYSVLYMHDGQNLFDPMTSSYGEIWDVHSTANRLMKAGLIKPIMIVGINNTKNRMDEYVPFDNSNIYKSYPDTNRVPYYGDLYSKFIVEELKPFIDKKYNTLPDFNSTFIAGSSLGGLISLYIGLTYPNIFKSIGALSISSWWNSTGYDALLKIKKPSNQQNYFITCGSNESGVHDKKKNSQYIKSAKLAKKYLSSNVNNLFYKVYDGGIHNEPFWSIQMVDFLLTCFK